MYCTYLTVNKITTSPRSATGQSEFDTRVSDRQISFLAARCQLPSKGRSLPRQTTRLTDHLASNSLLNPPSLPTACITYLKQPYCIISSVPSDHTEVSCHVFASIFLLLSVPLTINILLPACHLGLEFTALS